MGQLSKNWNIEDKAMVKKNIKEEDDDWFLSSL